VIDISSCLVVLQLAESSLVVRCCAYYLLVMFSEEEDVDAMFLEFTADFGTDPKTEAMIENGGWRIVLVYCWLM